MLWNWKFYQEQDFTENLQKLTFVSSFAVNAFLQSRRKFFHMPFSCCDIVYESLQNYMFLVNICKIVLEIEGNVENVQLTSISSYTQLL